MNQSIRSLHPAVLAAAVALSFASAGMAQERARLLPAQPGDLVPTQVVGGARVAAPDLERAPVEFFQALPADQVVSSNHEPFQAESREYWQQVEGEQLRGGYALALTSPGAVVMISPGVGARALHRDQLNVFSAGRSHGADEATQTLADADALRQAGMDVNPGTVAFKLRPGYEADARIHLAGAEGRYVLHVLEPASDDVLRAQAQVDTIHAGGQLSVRFALDGGAAIDAIAGVLVSPAGQAIDLSFDRGSRRAGGEIIGQVRAPEQVQAQPGLWDLRATVAGNDGQRAFQRDVRTAVAVVAPTARLNGNVSVNVRRGGGAMQTAFGIEVASAGRYELRGTLFGHDGKGELVPIGVAHVATWQQPGKGTLVLDWPNEALAAFTGPYELRDLRLSDQGAVAVLERRANALVIQ